ADIERLSTDFKSVDEFLKSACEAFENQKNDFTSKVTSIANNAFDIALEMQRIRDYDENNFTEKVSKAHDNLNAVWDLLRKNPFYYEINDSRLKGFD
ncbi:MAG: hypothetical protein ACPG44_10175, partial [Polaribacter sp.]